MKFQGRVALVTGGSRGIGKATALKLAGEGATVAVHYSRSIAKAEAVCKQIDALGQKAIPVQADISDREAVNSMVTAVTEKLGTIELLVNNAGDVGDIMFDELTPEHWDRIVAINLTGTFNVLWAVKPGMIEQQFGRIVNVSSIAALAVRPNQLPYAAAKAGIISLTKSCCGPLAPHNIRINSVAPGAIATDMLSEVSPEMVEQLRSTTPLGRLGEPEEMANVIAFLLSEESSFMTGATVIASGGRILIP
ncbi:MAG: SDR family NAD(P)-dependent oxidoreductase [Candidatus Poribacteria bacterium]|nr:SDR family NAD(P)-dependent oxidoreductase [Candidatus Poribacteria bacterium]